MISCCRVARSRIRLALSPLRLARRAYATHRDPSPSALLTQALDQKQRAASPRDSVGPFPLGIVPPPFTDDVKLKKWSQLSRGGKVLRTTARTTNFTVILLGAGLTAVLVYALTSELFAKNSPTVLYGEACERIKASPKVARYLHAPFSFHNTPPSTTRPRHRNHHVSSQLAVDAAGREHLLLNFYVRGSRHPSASQSADDGTSRIAQTRAALAKLTWVDSVARAKDAYASACARGKRAFLYLTGQPPPTSPLRIPDSGPGRRETKIGREPEQDAGGVWSFAGLFAGLRGGSRDPTRGRDAAEGPGTEQWEEGEVHADLVKDDNGYFVWRYILIDLPNSGSRYPTRVFVERRQDVREGEAVMRWY